MWSTCGFRSLTVLGTVHGPIVSHFAYVRRAVLLGSFRTALGHLSGLFPFFYSYF